jgi:predicted ATPase
MGERAAGEQVAGERVVGEGRSEAGELEEAWRRARGGRPTVVLVTGPAGAGKSALAAGAARRVTAEGGLVLFGGCDPARPTAYGPFVEAFDGLLAATPDDDRALATPGTRTALGRLLRARDTTSDPVLLAGGLAEVLGGLTTARPAMVVLADLQRAGAGACRLLEHLVRRAGHLGVLFVAIARDDLSPAHPLHGTAAALEHEGWLWRVPLAGADPETATRTATSGRLSPGRLPVHATSFVGREAECDQALAALRAGRLVTLVGTGGVGKTRLAVEIVRRSRLADHPDGVRFCDVAALGDPAGLVHHVAAAVGLATSRWGPAEARRELAAALGASRLLLVLDGCEHVRAAVAELAGELLDASTASPVLATSRAPLRTRDERVVAVAPLPVPTAVRLLVDRARAAGTTVAGDDPALAEIARRLDGLPLALELAAARLATLAPGDLAADLRRTFDLVGQAASGPLRQRTLQATVEWSWTLLGRPARRLLTALSVFRGGWTLDGARAVAPAVGVDPTEVPALLVELADQSMVRPESPYAAHGHDHPQSHDASSTYRMLGAVAAYAAERLAVSSDHRAVAEHHAIHVVAFAEQALAHRRGPAEPAWVRRVELGFDDLRAACRWSIDTDRPGHGLRLVAALAEDVMLRDRLEVGRWAEELAALPAVRNEPLRAVALGVAGTTAVAEDRLDDALRLGTAALDAERATGAPPCWLSRNVLALLAAVGRAGEASDELLGDVVLELDGIARAGEDPLVLAILLHQYVLAYAFAGQASKGVDAANELLALGREHPSPTIRAMGLLSHGLAVADGDPDLAAREYRAALDLATSARTTTLVQRAERALQELHARSSDNQATLGALRALLARRAPSDNLSEQIQTAVAMLDALVALGDLRSAATICGGLAHTPWQQGSTCQRADAAAARDLPPDHYHAARNAGAAMSSPELLAFAHRRAGELVRAGAHRGGPPAATPAASGAPSVRPARSVANEQDERPMS